MAAAQQSIRGDLRALAAGAAPFFRPLLYLRAAFAAYALLLEDGDHRRVLRALRGDGLAAFLYLRTVPSPRGSHPQFCLPAEIPRLRLRPAVLRAVLQQGRESLGDALLARFGVLALRANRRLLLRFLSAHELCDSETPSMKIPRGGQVAARRPRPAESRGSRWHRWNRRDRRV